MLSSQFWEKERPFMKTRNKFYRLFAISKGLVLLFALILFALQFAFAALGSGVGVIVITMMAYLLIAFFAFLYAVNVARHRLYGYGRRNLVAPLVLYALLNILLSIFFVISVNVELEAFRYIEVALRFNTLLSAFIFFIGFSSQLTGYKEYKRTRKYLKSLDDDDYLDRFMNTEILDEDYEIVYEAKKRNAYNID